MPKSVQFIQTKHLMAEGNVRAHLDTVFMVINRLCRQRLNFSRPAGCDSPSPRGEGRGEVERTSNFSATSTSKTKNSVKMHPGFCCL